MSVVVLPGDVALQAATGASPKFGSLLLPAPLTATSPSDLDRLAALLNGAKRVTVLCGSGRQGAHAELLKLGDRLKAPMLHALRGKEHVGWENPYDLGMTGLIGFSYGYYAMRDCEVLLILGSDSQVDLRAANIGRRVPVDLGLVGDVGATIAALLPLLEVKRDGTHLGRAQRHYAKARQELEHLATAHLEAADPSPAGRQDHRRAGRRRRDLHVRRRCRPCGLLVISR